MHSLSLQHAVPIWLLGLDVPGVVRGRAGTRARSYFCIQCNCSRWTCMWAGGVGTEPVCGEGLG
ncbi:hypothetical protein PUR61_06890, partial [Streptomyces sp. BE20]|uniref:hypothetical protein n=1 Tax=Streptomyces sp. BE20 TaxID=3002525 RepID=UPI002E78C3E5